MHNIEGHLFRITRVPDFMNKFEMRVDNQGFEEMKELRKFGAEDKGVEKSRFKKDKNDPFEDFGIVAKESKGGKSNNN